MSRMPSASPTSQCGRGVPSSFFGSSLRTIRLSCSSLPRGTRGSMTFGIQRTYSFVGGLATRMIDLADALVDRGHQVRHIFVGDPKLPAVEERSNGSLILERWSQWISRYHPKDVYDGEDGKWRDFSRTAPPHIADLVRAAAASGRRAVVLFEDWQTADAAIATAAIL